MLPRSFLRPAGLAVLWLLCGAAFLGCGATQPPGQTSSDKVKLTLVRAQPSGGAVPRKTAVEAEVAYSIRGFSPGRYFLQPQFENEAGESIEVALRPDESRGLERAEAHVKMRVSLDRSLAGGARLRGPVALWLCLTQRVAKRSTLLARVGPLRFDLP
jgi:hypothetical protein